VTIAKNPQHFRRRAAASTGKERWQRFVHSDHRKLHRDFSGKSPDLDMHIQGGNVDNGLSIEQIQKIPAGFR